MDVAGTTKKSMISECGEEFRGGRKFGDEPEELVRSVAERHGRGCGETGAGAGCRRWTLVKEEMVEQEDQACGWWKSRFAWRHRGSGLPGD